MQVYVLDVIDVDSPADIQLAIKKMREALTKIHLSNRRLVVEICTETKRVINIPRRKK
jgi:hypothetical protein